MQLNRRRATVAAALLVVLALLAGCGTLSAFIDLTRNLQSAGYTHVRVNIDQSSGGSGVVIDADKPDAQTVDEATTAATRIVWTTFPRRIESVRVDMNGQTTTFDRLEMTRQFGTRDPSLDAKSLKGSVNGFAGAALIGLLVVVVVIALIVVLIVVLVKRSRKKKRLAWEAQNAQYQGGWGDSGYGPSGGYGQPAPYPPPGQYPPPGPGAYPPPGQYPPPGPGAYPPPGQTPPAGPGAYPPPAAPGAYPPAAPPAPPPAAPTQNPPGWD